MESEPAVDTLPRRAAAMALKGEVCEGEVPESPRVLIDIRRRCWSWAAAVEMGPGKGFWPVEADDPETLLERPKMELKVLEVKEPRRGRPPVGESTGLLFSLAMLMVVGRVGNALSVRNGPASAR